jgi:two-component system LytT family response regulator
VLAKIKPTGHPAVIFATAYDDFALEAFELFAVDYLLKPFTDERFAESLQRGKQRARHPDSAALGAAIDSLLEHFSQRKPPAGSAREYTAAMPFKVGLDRHLLRPCDIRWIEGQSDYVRIHTTKQALLIRRTMSNLLTQLPAGKFVRIHKSAIINLDCVKRMRSAWSGDWSLELDDGTQLKVSRNYREHLEKLL